MKTHVLSIIGLGHLGAPMLAVFTGYGYRVIGVDTDTEKMRAVNDGHAPVYEPGLEGTLKKNKALYQATPNLPYAVRNSDVTFIVVPTPSLPSGEFSITAVKVVARDIGEVLADNNMGYHLVVITSTVNPGDMSTIRDTIEAASGKECGRDFGLVYNPEFIALGSVIKNFSEPDYILIGENDTRSGSILEQIYRPFGAPVKRMSWVSAELAKLSQNVYLDVKISFANALTELCEAFNADPVAVLDAIGSDTRVGHKFFKPGAPYGGPCLPRDCRALIQSAGRVHETFDLAIVADCINSDLTEALIADVRAAYVLTPGKVGIIGVGYKLETNVLTESFGVKLLRALLEKGIPVVVFDPAVTSHELDTELGCHVPFVLSADQVVQEVGIVVLALPYKNFDTSLIGEKVVFDWWHIL